jgi:hypothetical protein
MPRIDDANAASIARLRFRRVLALSFFIGCIALMPIGLACPCGIGIALRGRVPEGVVTTFYVLAFVLPLVGLAGTLLMGMDIGRYGHKVAVARAIDALGMAYTEWPKEKQYSFARSLRLFAEQTFDSATNYFEGKYRRCKVTGLDYSFTWGVGRYQAAYTQTVLLLHDAVPDVPNFVLSPRGLLDRISPWLGKDRIELEDEDEFNRRFALSGRVRQDDIAECFTTAVVDLCLEDATISVEVFSGDLIVCRQGRTLTAGGYEPLLDHAVRLAETLAPLAD